MPRLKDTYEKEIVAKLMSKLSLKNRHDAPKINKIILQSPRAGLMLSINSNRSIVMSNIHLRTALAKGIRVCATKSQSKPLP